MPWKGGVLGGSVSDISWGGGSNVMVGRVTEMEGKLCSVMFVDQRNKPMSNNWPPLTVKVYT
jgi:hypothetical protein